MFQTCISPRMFIKYCTIILSNILAKHTVYNILNIRIIFQEWFKKFLYSIWYFFFTPPWNLSHLETIVTDMKSSWLQVWNCQLLTVTFYTYCWSIIWFIPYLILKSGFNVNGKWKKAFDNLISYIKTEHLWLKQTGSVVTLCPLHLFV